MNSWLSWAFLCWFSQRLGQTLWFLLLSSLGTLLLMWATTTTSLHPSRQTSLLMEETLWLIDQLEDSAMESLPQTSLVKNFLPTVFYPPFCLKIISSALPFTAEYLGFTSYPPAYLSPEAEGQNLLTGVNFASAASGYLDYTPFLYVSSKNSLPSSLSLSCWSLLVLQNTLSLTRQLNYYRQYQNEVVSMVGSNNTSAIFSGAIHLLSAGTSDFIQNYYINPLLRIYSPDQFSNILIRSYSTFIQVTPQLRLYTIYFLFIWK